MTRIREPEAIHGWFGLTYANYLTIPRSVLQSMPDSWQNKFVDLLLEMEHEFGYLDWPHYEVKTLIREPHFIRYEECPSCLGEGTDEDEFEETCEWCDGEGSVECDRYEEPEEVGFRTDPIPHYNRGRTRLTRASEMHTE